MTGEDAFNPLDMANLRESIGNALLSTAPTRLDKTTAFRGAGIYAIYYTGAFKAYELLAEKNRGDQWAAPIYVGKAVPAGARKGIALDAETRALGKRIGEHAKSVQAAENLEVEDFYARWLVTEPIWIPLGESLLIGRYAPVWNTIVDGFGNHNPGKGRHAGMVSRWDVLHPGRFWAQKFAPRNETAEDIAKDVIEYLRQRDQV